MMGCHQGSTWGQRSVNRVTDRGFSGGWRLTLIQKGGPEYGARHSCNADGPVRAQ